MVTRPGSERRRSELTANQERMRFIARDVQDYAEKALLDPSLIAERSSGVGPPQKKSAHTQISSCLIGRLLTPVGQHRLIHRVDSVGGVYRTELTRSSHIVYRIL